MRLLGLTLIATLGVALIPNTATARSTDPCAALTGRDLAPGAAQRAVRRGATLHFCGRGHDVRRLGGAPTVEDADGNLLLLRRRGMVEVLDVTTGRRAALGKVGQIRRPEVIASAGAAAVRRTATEDTVVVAAPGRPELVVERGTGPVTGFTAKTGLRWERAGVARTARLPRRAYRCGDLRGRDRLDGPGRIVQRGPRHLGCSEAKTGPVFVLGDETTEGIDDAAVSFTAGAGTWVLRETGRASQYRTDRFWDTLDLATGRVVRVAHHGGGFCCEDEGNALSRHVMLPDGRGAALLEDDWIGQATHRSTVTVNAPGLAPVTLERTERDAPKATNLRIEGETVRWTVGAEERSAPLPPVASTAEPDPRCATLKGRDLASSKYYRAVRSGPTLLFCVIGGGKVRTLPGAPVVRGSDGALALLHRGGVVEVLDLHTGLVGTVGPIAEIAAAKVVSAAGVVAVRRTAAGDALIVAAPGRAEVVIEHGSAPVEDLQVGQGVSWTRAGVTQRAALPVREFRCGDLRGEDVLAGPGRISAFVVNRIFQYHLGCTGAPDAPTYALGGAHVSAAGSWLLLRAEGGGDPRDRYFTTFTVTWTLLDLATGRGRKVGSYSGGVATDDFGRVLGIHVLLEDGRMVAVVDEDHYLGKPRRTAIIVNGPGGAEQDLAVFESGTPRPMGLRVDGDVVRWTVSGEERSAPLPPVS